MDSNDTSEEGGGENHQHSQSHHGLSGAVVETTSPPQKPQESWADGVDKEEYVGNASEEDVKSRDARSGVDEGDAQS